MKPTIIEQSSATSKSLEQGAFNITYLKGYECDHDLEKKLIDLIDLSEKLGLGIARNYRDVVSCHDCKRVPQFDELKTAVSSHKIGSVVLWSLCDFGYNTNAIYKALDYLNTFDVRVIALKEGLDTLEFPKSALVNFLSVFSKAEIGLEVDRTFRINDGRKIFSSHMIWRSADV